ncbi:MAG: hypothetical protein AAGA61_01880 [Pseudomonadota bacterium]
MERFLLYWDDLDDLLHAIVFVGERRRSRIRHVAGAMGLGAIGAAAVYTALHEPVLGAASVALFSVLLIHRSVTAPHAS